MIFVSIAERVNLWQNTLKQVQSVVRQYNVGIDSLSLSVSFPFVSLLPWLAVSSGLILLADLVTVASRLMRRRQVSLDLAAK